MVASPAVEHAARRMRPPKVRIVARRRVRGNVVAELRRPRPGRPHYPLGPCGPAGPAGPCGPAGPDAPVAPRGPRIVGTTDAGSFAFRPSATSRPGFGVRDALIPFTAPAFEANATIERLAAPPAGEAARAASTSTTPARTTNVRAFRTKDLLRRLRTSRSPQVRLGAAFRAVTESRRTFGTRLQRRPLGTMSRMTELTPEERAGSPSSRITSRRSPYGTSRGSPSCAS